MRNVICNNDKAALALAINSDKRTEAAPGRVRMIRLDRHIRQAECAERLKGRS